MIPAERNYSKNKREDLVEVWALEKFRARWTLKTQSINLKIDYTPGKANVVADMLSRPSYTEGAPSDVCTTTVDMPSRTSSDILKGQLEDEELKKIIDCFESIDKDENFANYTSRGYLMNQDILYRYSPESEEEAQLVVPAQK
ncbi:retrovirus-related Pol polyprotein from transposon 17.6 [Trichonephila clavipes]|nr:retrovirus-related Pol polyprotein from transposon 17.6 [Trichonephila clavipes]